MPSRDVLGLKHSLHRGFGDAKPFYLSYTGMVVIAAAIVLIPGAPLGLITTGVQALAGLLLPSATVFGAVVQRPGSLRPLGEPAVAQRSVRAHRQCAVATFGNTHGHDRIPRLDIVSLAADLTVGIALCSATVFGVLRWYGRHRPKHNGLTSPLDLATAQRATWRMPPLTSLKPVSWSAGTRLGMLALRGYLVVGAILLVAKAIQLGST